MKKESIGYVVVFTFVVCVVFVLPLALAEGLTKPRVEANRLYAAHVAVLKAFALADATTPRDEVERIYAQSVKEVSGEDGVWKADIGGSAAVAVRYIGPGLWGSITAIVAADVSGSRLLGLEILDQVETPGLGGRIDETAFKAQFAGLKVGAEGIRVGPAGDFRNPDKEAGRVDAVAGASRTSDFIGQIVNGAIVRIKTLGGTK